MAFALATLLALGGCGGETAKSAGGDGPVLLKIAIDDQGMNEVLNREAFERFTAQTGIQVETVFIPRDATEALTLYRQYLTGDSIDLYQIDVIWPGILENQLLDLSGKVEADEFFPPLIANNTVNGRLVALPWWSDAGLLFYRQDLLEKHGFDAPPETWDELEAIAQAIMDAEHKEGNLALIGYVWQGKAYEGLTCNGLEWISSHGGGTIIDQNGEVTINNPQAVAALERAARWVGGISPRGVTAYMEPESLGVFQNGNAVFLRSWPYAWAEVNKEGSPVAGKVGVALLPKAEGQDPAAALGGWQVGISKNSKYPEEAIALAKFLTSPDVLKERAIRGGYLPTRVALYQDAEITAAIPYFPEYRDVLMNATARPSTVTGRRYNEVSTIFFQGVSSVLNGQRPAAEAVAAIEQDIRAVLGR